MGRLGPETGLEALATGSGASFLLGCLGCRSGGCFQKIRKTILISMLYGGGSGIRTLDTVSGTLFFQGLVGRASAYDVPLA